MKEISKIKIKAWIKKYLRVFLLFYHKNKITECIFRPLSFCVKRILPNGIVWKIEAYSLQCRFYSIQPQSPVKNKIKVCKNFFVWNSPIRNYDRVQQKKNRAVVFASFNADGIITEYVVELLKGLQSVAQYIVFIADNGIANKEEVKKIATLVDHAEFIRHGGYDFNSYKKGIKYLENQSLLNSFDELILMNDSCYGFIYPLETVFSSMDNVDCNFWGLCDSYEVKHHIQSFFYVFKKEVFLDSLFKSFWMDIKGKLSFLEAVGLERSLTFFLEQKFMSDSYISAFCKDNAREFLGGNQNGTVWPYSQINMGMPLVKVKALTNCFGKDLNEGVEETLNLIKSKNIDLYSVILRDLNRRNISIPHMYDDIEDSDVVSFDIFDTLLIRPFVCPTDVFLFIEKQFQISGFAKERIDAERRARVIFKNQNDITLEQIYSQILPKFKAYITLEKEIEISLLRANPLIKPIYGYAKELNKKIICTSDMYLDEGTISSALKNNGFEIDSIFVSAKENATKGSGVLFNTVSLKCGVSLNKFFHIGDNIVSDVEVPSKYGIRAYNIQKYIDKVLSMPSMIKYLQFWIHNQTLQTSAYIALISNYILSINLETNYWEYLGFCLGGPLALAYTWHIVKESQANNIDELLFVARDGFILKKIYEKYFKNSNLFNDLPHAEYVYLTRAICLKANLLPEDDSAYVLAILKNAQKNNPEIRFSENYKENECIYQRYKEVINRDANGMRIILQKYMNKLSENYSNIATVDMTTGKMTSARAAKFLLRDKFKIGFFSGTFCENNELCYDSFCSRMYTSADDIVLKISELMISSPEKPIIDLKDGIPQYGLEYGYRSEIYPLIERGIYNYIETFFNWFGYKSNALQFSMEQWMELAKNYIKYSNEIDLMHLDTIIDTPDATNLGEGISMGRLVRKIKAGWGGVSSSPSCLFFITVETQADFSLSIQQEAA